MAMATMDWQKERKRLAERYAAMQDGELQEIANSPESLTDVARQVLRSEMASRGMPALRHTSTRADLEQQGDGLRFGCADCVAQHVNAAPRIFFTGQQMDQPILLDAIERRCFVVQ